MRIAMGSDHRGVASARGLAGHLKTAGHEVAVLGPCDGEPCDYPDAAWLVARAVGDGAADRGILICSNGVGMAIAANKVKGVRAALVYDAATAEQSRRHNDANVVCVGGEVHSERELIEIVDRWVGTEFEGGRHARRVRKIEAIEAGRDPTTVTDETRTPAPSQ